MEVIRLQGVRQPSAVSPLYVEVRQRLVAHKHALHRGGRGGVVDDELRDAQCDAIDDLQSSR